MVARLAPPKTGSRALSRARHGGRHRRHRRAHRQCLGRLCRSHRRRHQFRHAAGGRRARQELALPAQAKFVEANAEELPFEDESFDAYTIAFGIRNVPRIELALSEAHRVLKRGGRFLCLEFSTRRPARARPALQGCSRDRVIPPIGPRGDRRRAALPATSSNRSASSRRPAHSRR